jgi:hypothetical protein
VLLPDRILERNLSPNTSQDFSDNRMSGAARSFLAHNAASAPGILIARNDEEDATTRCPAVSGSIRGASKASKRKRFAPRFTC